MRRGASLGPIAVANRVVWWSTHSPRGAALRPLPPGVPWRSRSSAATGSRSCSGVRRIGAASPPGATCPRRSSSRRSTWSQPSCSDRTRERALTREPKSATGPRFAPAEYYTCCAAPQRQESDRLRPSPALPEQAMETHGGDCIFIFIKQYYNRKFLPGVDDAIDKSLSA